MNQPSRRAALALAVALLSGSAGARPEPSLNTARIEQLTGAKGAHFWGVGATTHLAHGIASALKVQGQ